MLIHICGSGHFLDAFNTLTEKGSVLREISNLKVKEKTVRVGCDCTQTIVGVDVAM